VPISGLRRRDQSEREFEISELVKTVGTDPRLAGQLRQDGLVIPAGIFAVRCRPQSAVGGPGRVVGVVDEVIERRQELLLLLVETIEFPGTGLSGDRRKGPSVADAAAADRVLVEPRRQASVPGTAQTVRHRKSVFRRICLTRQAVGDGRHDRIFVDGVRSVEVGRPVADSKVERRTARMVSGGSWSPACRGF